MRSHLWVAVAGVAVVLFVLALASVSVTGNISAL
jgi:hypothetical protein